MINVIYVWPIIYGPRYVVSCKIWHEFAVPVTSNVNICWTLQTAQEPDVWGVAWGTLQPGLPPFLMGSVQQVPGLNPLPGIFSIPDPRPIFSFENHHVTGTRNSGCYPLFRVNPKFQVSPDVLGIPRHDWDSDLDFKITWELVHFFSL